MQTVKKGQNGCLRGEIRFVGELTDEVEAAKETASSNSPVVEESPWHERLGGRVFVFDKCIKGEDAEEDETRDAHCVEKMMLARFLQMQ